MRPEPGPFGSHKCGCTIARLGEYIQIEYCDAHQAAPDLLTALKELVERREVVGTQYAAVLGNDRGLFDGHDGRYARARAAIAKAEGKEGA